MAAFGALALLLTACSFNYGVENTEEDTKPDIVFNNLEYVRVRGGQAQAKFKAEEAARYEKRRVMELFELSFEQYNKATGELDASGNAGKAEVELASGNVELKNGIDLTVESEDLAIETNLLQWNDGDRTLKGGEGEVVVIKNSTGKTNFSGKTFSADVRKRSFEFTDGADGAFDQDDDEDDEAAAEVEEDADDVTSN